VWFLRNANSSGHATVAAFAFGEATDVPLIGDWNGDGTETVGVFRNGRWFFKNANAGGFDDGFFDYGQAGDRPRIWFSP
jgi:hypothetical protein